MLDWWISSSFPCVAKRCVKWLVMSCACRFPDDEAGELPMAFVVKRDGSELNESEVMSFVGKLVAPHKKVRKVEFTNAIPKSATGKILRKELIAKIKQQLSS